MILSVLPHRLQPRAVAGVLGWVCGLFIAGLLALLLAAAWWSRSDALQDAEGVAARLTQTVENQLARIVEGADLLLHQQRDLASATDWTDAEQARVADRRLSEMANRLPYVFRLFTIGPDGTVLASSMDPTPALNTADRGYFMAQREADRGLFISGPLRSRASGEPIIIFSRRVETSGGEFGGVVIASFELERLARFFSGLPLQYEAVLQLLDVDMEVLLSAPARHAEAALGVPPAVRERIREGASPVHAQTYLGESRVWAFQRVNRYPLLVGVGLDKEAVLRDWYAASFAYFIFGTLALAGLALVSAVAVQRARNADRYRAQLVGVNSELENRVSERTRELGQANERLREAIAGLREESLTLEAIDRINTSIAAELEMDRLVQTVTDAATEITGARYGAFFYNERGAEGNRYSLYALSGAPPEAFARFPMPRPTQIFGPTFRGEGVVRIADVLQDPRYGKNTPHAGMPEGHLPVRSYLAVPVTSRSGEVLGGLLFGHPKPGVFTERAERIITAIAAQAAIALGKAQLYRAAQNEIASREQAEAALRESEGRFRQLADSMPQIVWTARPDGRIDYYNRRWYEFTGLEEGDLARWHGILHPDDVDRTRVAWLESLETGKPCEVEFRLRNRDGTFRWHLGRALPVRGGDGKILHWFATSTDIDDLKRAEQDLSRHRDRLTEQALALERALADKTILFQEVHHRVKNNLQVICSLVRMQAKLVAEGPSRTALDDTYNRIYAIGLVHDVLYAGDEASDLEIGAYLERLCNVLSQVYAADERQIRVDIDAAGTLDLVRAVPVGLLVNELLSNALKHAFPNDGPGRVRVMFRSGEDHELIVGDDGIGMPASIERPGSLGMTIIRTLVGQLGASMSREDGAGTTVRITFPA